MENSDEKISKVLVSKKYLIAYAIYILGLFLFWYFTILKF